MTKKRKEKKKEQGVKGTVSFHGGNTKFQVFDFDGEEDDTGGLNSRKFAAVLAPTSPIKPRRRSLNKFDFLETFAAGQLNSSGNETSVSSVTEEGQKVSPGTMFKSLSIGTNSRVIGRSSPRTARKIKKAGECKLEKKRKHVYNLESDDEEGVVEMQMSTTCDLTNGSIQEKEQEVSSQLGSDRIDCEPVVVVSPLYVKVGNASYPKCSLTFSSSYIKLEGCLLGKEELHSLDWSPSDIVKIEHQLRESDKTDVVKLILRTWDANEDEACKTSSGTLELEFVIVDETQWCKKQEDIRSLNTKYKSAWETIRSECSFNEHFDDIVYPEGDPDGIFISRGDVDRLKPMAFLNDTIIDFYIKYLLSNTKPEEKRRFHFFNTFFFRKLADMDKVSSRTRDAGEAFQCVRKWTRNIDLFNKDYIFIPVNFSLHWSLIIICHLGELANIRDSDFAESSVRPCIIHMDSLQGNHRGLENVIRSYLWEEWRERYDKQDADIRAKFLSLNFEALQLPQQDNFFDCGLFLLHYAELFLAQAANFSAGKYSDVLNKEWFLPAEVSSKKRHDIRKLISKLASDSAGKERHCPCADKTVSINEGDKSVEVVSLRDVKETSDGLNKIIEQSLLFDLHTPENKHQLVICESLQQFEQLVPASPTSCMRLPMENYLPGDIRSTSQADEDDKSAQIHLTPSSIKIGDIEVPLDVSSLSTGVPQRIANANNGDHPIYEVASTPEKTKRKFLHCLESCDDNAHIIVEDSEEEEFGAESSRRTRKSTVRGVC